jgi:hypothetical protein
VVGFFVPAHPQADVVLCFSLALSPVAQEMDLIWWFWAFVLTSFLFTYLSYLSKFPVP